jgi:hypothetical protein
MSRIHPRILASSGVAVGGILPVLSAERGTRVDSDLAREDVTHCDIYWVRLYAGVGYFPILFFRLTPRFYETLTAHRAGEFLERKGRITEKPF